VTPILLNKSSPILFLPPPEAPSPEPDAGWGAAGGYSEQHLAHGVSVVLEGGRERRGKRWEREGGIEGEGERGIEGERERGRVGRTGREGGGEGERKAEGRKGGREDSGDSEGERERAIRREREAKLSQILKNTSGKEVTFLGGCFLWFGLGLRIWRLGFRFVLWFQQTIYELMNAHALACTCTYTCLHSTCMHIHMHMRVQVEYELVHTHTHAYTYTCTCVCV
jgi:hypothetical protein